MSAEPEYPTWVSKAANLAYPILGKLLGWSITKLQNVIWRSYTITEQESERIANMKQRTADWFRIRNGWVILDQEIFRGTLVSSSVVGKILKHEGSYGPPDLYEDGTEQKYGMLFRTQRGTAAEPATQEEFVLVAKQHFGPQYEVSVEEVGIKVSPALPYCAASIDTKIHMLDTETLEYSTAGLEMKCRGTPGTPPPKWIPKNYHDQLAISMFIYGWQKYWFIFHSDAVFSVQLFEFDAKQWAKNMDIVDAWYWGNYWPALVLAHCKKLRFDDDCLKLTGDERKDAENMFAWAKTHDVLMAL